MHPPQYCPHALDLQVRRRSIANDTATSKPASRFKNKHVSSKKTYKSKLVSQSQETPMISKTRHDDGGNGNPRFHETIRTTHRFVKNREYKKTYKSKHVTKSIRKH